MLMANKGLWLARLLMLALPASEMRAQVTPPYQTAPPAVIADDPRIWGLGRARGYGWPSLAERILPTGYQERRLISGCGACIPELGVRLLRHPDGHVEGEAFVITNPSQVADTARRWFRRTPTACEPWLGGGYGDLKRCAVNLTTDVTWHKLWDSLEVAGFGQLQGARWPRPGLSRAEIEEAVAKYDSLQRSGACGDVGTRSLDIEELNGAERRQARFVCIEVATSSDTQRAIDIVALLRRLFLTGPARAARQTREPLLLNLSDTPSEIDS